MQRNLVFPLIAAAAAIVGCSENPTQVQTESQLTKRVGPPAPLYLAEGRAAGTFPNRYIVVVNDAAPDAVGLANQLGRLNGFDIKVAGNIGLRFFAAELSPAIVEALRLDPRIKYVAEDQMVQLGETYPSPPSWGLDRIDQSQLPLNNTYQDYLGGNTTLVTSHSYIIDSGIRYTHQEFEGRAFPAFDYDSANSPRGSPNFAVDCNGHGTHVSGTVGGRTVGVAKRTQLYGVRVFDCLASSQLTSVIAAGINWVTANAVQPAVANMSIWGLANVPLDDAVRASINAGITYVVIAGNGNDNACNYSPARVTQAITVAATDINDFRSTFSSFGSCVDLFAPGTDITSAWSGSDTDFRNDSGTSMAAPHVTGVVANLIAWFSQPNQPAQVHSSVINFQVTTGVVKNPGAGSPNRLLNSITPFNIDVTGPQDIACGATGTYQIQGFGGVGPYDFSGYLTHMNGDMFKTFTGPTFVENAPIDGFTQTMGLIVNAHDARGSGGQFDWGGYFICEYF